MKELIKEYIYKNPEKFDFKTIKSINVDFLARGEYNENYLVKINNKSFVFRINFYQQSGLKNQVQYEFKTLKFLEDFEITPKPVFYDDSKHFFDYDIIVYEYVDGKYPKCKEQEIKALAESFNVLHSIKIPKNMEFMKRDFIEGDKEFISEKFQYYKQISDDKETIELFEKAIKNFFYIKYDIKPTWTIIHTDPVPSNMIFHSKQRKVMFIDWEKARVDDPSYDLCLLFSPATAWDWSKPLNDKLKKCFIENYKGFKYDPNLMKKIKIRYPFTVMWFALWTVIRIAEIKKGLIDKKMISDMERYYKFRDILLGELKQLITSDSYFKNL